MTVGFKLRILRCFIHEDKVYSDNQKTSQTNVKFSIYTYKGIFLGIDSVLDRLAILIETYDAFYGFPENPIKPRYKRYRRY